MTKGIAISALAAAALTAGVGTTAAHSTTIGPRLVTATFTGTVDPSSGIDTLGEFGAPGGNIGGLPFTATFTVNERIPNLYPGSQVSEYIGALSADLSINGEDVRLQGSNDFRSDLGEQDVLGNAPGADNSYGYFANVEGAVPLTNSITLLKQLSLTIILPLYLPSGADYRTYAFSGDSWNPAPSGPGFLLQGGFDIFANPPGIAQINESLGLMPDSLMVTSRPAPLLTSAALLGAVAVPEPAAWATMLVGLGGLGAVARGHRRVAPRPA